MRHALSYFMIIGYTLVPMKGVIRSTLLAGMSGLFVLVWLVSRQRPRARLAIISTSNEVLLVQNLIGSGEWELPGGGAKRGETLDKAAVRETNEEVGLMIDEATLTDLGLHKTAHRLAPMNLQAYGVRYESTAEPRITSHEIAQLRWWPLEQLPEDKNNNFTDILQRWNDTTTS